MIDQIRNELQNFCSEFGYSVEQAEKQILKIGEPQYKSGTKSILIVCFAAIAYAIKSITNILEIGTGAGNNVRILSKIFPKSNIYTIDISDTDPDYKKLSWRQTKEEAKEYKDNISRDNIHLIITNSLLLPLIDLPMKFDLIFIDGGHNHPVVGCDTMYSYSRLKKDGFLFMHDYTTLSNINDILSVVNYFGGIIDEKFRLLPDNYNQPESRIAWLRKK